MRGPVICYLAWLGSLVLQHDVEELTAVAASLHLAVNVEIEDRQRFHLDYSPGSVADEQLLEANLEETDALVGLRPYEDNVTVRT